MPIPNNTVAPAWRSCRMTGIASFKAGIWNGKEHDANFCKTIADNFRKFSSGPSPYYRPYVSLNHKDELRCGYVDGAEVDRAGILRLDADGIPEPVASWRNAGGLVQPSIEYFEPVYDDAGNLVDGFRLPDGSISKTPVLKCLTLLGADAPAVKGLPDLPPATYSEPGQPTKQFSASGKCVRRFANAEPATTPQLQGATMDRAAMIAALQAMNVDTAGITDAVPDEVLKAWLDSLQKLQAAPAAPAEPAEPITPPVQMADMGAGAAIAPAAPAIPGIGSQQPSSVVLKFSDQSGLQRWMNEKESQFRQLQQIAAQATQALAAVNGAATQQANAAKFSDVSAFVERLATPDANRQVRIQPAQKAFFVQTLMKYDGARVRKFSDGSGSGTELEEAKRQLLATLPKLTLGDKMRDPAASGPGGASPAGGIDPDRRARMLKQTPAGRAILAAEAKK